MYYLVYGLLYLISLLPLRVLYILSDGFYVLIYYVFGYRKKVVFNNLQIAFPEKSEGERKRIAKKFYQNFIDTFIETIKMVSASDKYILNRVSGNWEVLNELYKTGRSVQIHLGHTFNWEWANLAGARAMHYTFLGVYMPIRNQIFDRLFKKIRSKSGTVMLPATNMRNEMLHWRTQQYALGLVADQAPPGPEKAFWLNFFGKPTPFVTGPETGARAGNIPVVFANIEKPRRGYYKVIFTMGDIEPGTLPRGELTRRYVAHLEKVIQQNPDMWLWSHRRWKQEWKEEYSNLWIG
jgi:Kdo2-lipid IVA lauroyltransferase/acyltransferase